MEKINVDIDIDPVAEMIKLQNLYKHYKTLYRHLFFLCCSDQRKIAKEKRDACKKRIDEIIEERCKNL